ncbi:MAG: hypothetical protein KAG53_04725, partial [Endozoicomonadaceae bacterium]|nr:hypothetical protein [Endozoicomonadaceae bacterium]
MTGKGASVKFPLNIKAHERVKVDFIWAGWGSRTLVNISYGNKVIASKYPVHGEAWNSPKTSSFYLDSSDCTTTNCYITLQLDNKSPMVLFFKQLTIDDMVSPDVLPSSEIGKFSADIAKNKLVRYRRSGVFTGDPIYHGSHDWQYNSWRVTGNGAYIKFPLNIKAHERVRAEFVWAGWGKNTLINISYGNKVIASKYPIHGHAWNAPQTSSFYLDSSDCTTANCYITLQLDKQSRQALFFKQLTINSPNVAHITEIGSFSAEIAKNKLVRYRRSGVFTGDPIYHGSHDWQYNSWRVTGNGAYIKFPLNIKAHERVKAEFVWAGWGNDTLINVFYGNRVIASKYPIHGHAWNAPQINTFYIDSSYCTTANCYITFQLDKQSGMSLFFKRLTIDDMVSPDVTKLSQQPLFLPPGLSDEAACIGQTPRIDHYKTSLVGEPDVGQVHRRIFQTKFNSSDWSGDLVAMSIDRDGNLLRNADGSEVVHWSAANKLAQLQSNSRKIFTVDLKSKLPTALTGIVYSTVRLDSQAYVRGVPITTGARPKFAYEYEVMNYWHGNKSYEIGPSRTQGFRSRSTLLGDIVNSVPTYVGPPDFPYPDNELCGTTSYSSFKNAHANRSPMLYVGANDGMVHGFSADTGVEAMAFIPSYRDMHDLVTPDYSHRYYVDASPSAVDACVGSTWKTLLIGGLGAGGRAIYALNVTDPATDFSANNILAWEFKRSTDHQDLGYTFGTPVITKLASGQWVAIFGNGYHNNSTGRAYLYVVNLQDGSLIKKIDTQMGTLAKPNGLSSV